MNKPKRTQTLNSFFIKKPKNISTTSSDSDSDQYREAGENVVLNSSIINVSQYIIDNVNEITTPILTPENNPLSIQDNTSSFTNSTTSNEPCPLDIYLVHFYFFFL